MNGVHDMGGMHGFGPVQPDRDEAPFHGEWEARAFAMNRATGFLGAWNIDIGRYARETLPPHVYLGTTYYQKWALGLEKLLLDHGLVQADEIAAGHALHPAKPVKGTLTAANADRALSRSTFARPAPAPARFAAGDRVRTKNIHPVGHTRLPRYARGHVGVVEAVRGCHVFPDSVVSGKGEDPHWLYTVVFSGRDLWGDDADPTVKVSVEAWEPYLDLA
jgi:nitrile hydratase beta subunit